MKQPLLIEQNVGILHTLQNLIEQLSSAEYNATDAPYYSSSFGAHARHILDHYLVLLADLDSGIIDYDQRKRDLAIATDPTVAKTTIQAIIGLLQDLSDTDIPLQIGQQVAVDQDASTQSSTLGRELVFLYSHTTHHHSLMILIMRLIGKQVDGSADYAPSTLKHLQATACAQ